MLFPINKDRTRALGLCFDEHLYPIGGADSSDDALGRRLRSSVAVATALRVSRNLSAATAAPGGKRPVRFSGVGPNSGHLFGSLLLPRDEGLMSNDVLEGPFR